MYNNRKTLTAIIFLSLMLHTFTATAASSVKLTIEPRTWANYGDALKVKAEQNISALLTNINVAEERQAPISYAGIIITDDAARSLNMLWKSLSHFKCEETEMNQNCFCIGPNFQLRRIGVELTTTGYKGKRYRELIVNFDRSGRIVRVILQPEDVSASSFMQGGDEADMDKRMQILNYVESFRSCYEQKNWNALNTIFSDNALIITGEVVKATTSHIRENRVWRPGHVKYTVQTKQEYMQNLQRLFRNTRYINVEFSDIRVEQHPAKPQYFGVHLRQKWASQNRQGRKYMDDGNLFLLWDFTDPDRPVIHVRKWTNVEDNVTVRDFKYE